MTKTKTRRMPPTLTPAGVDRFGRDLGELVVGMRIDTLTLAELRQYATPDGMPSAAGFVRFCSEILPLELTPQQLEAAAALAEHPQVLIVGAQGVGKDLLKQAFLLYWSFCVQGLAIATAPGDRTVREITMRRGIGWLWLRARRLPGALFEMGVRVDGLPEGGLLAFSASDPERFVGHHSQTGRVLVAATEAQGLGPELIEAMQRLTPTRTLLVCNPTTPACAAYGLSRSAAWRTLVWSALDHPNVTSGREVIRGAVTREWVERSRREHGEHSRFWQYAVLAQWPASAENALIRPEWWDAAVSVEQRVRVEIRDHGGLGGWAPDRWVAPIVGVDPAREGEDFTAMCVRQGSLVLELARWRERDTMENCRRIERHVRRLVARYHGVGAVIVDSVALGGGIEDSLRERMPGIRFSVPRGHYDLHTVSPQVVGFKSSVRAGDVRRFANRRAETYHAVGVLFERGAIAFAPESEELPPELVKVLGAELRAHVVEHRADDRIDVGGKNDVRRQLGRSPDLADALVMAFSTDVDDGARRVRFA